MPVKAILAEQNKDTPTILAIKDDTTKIIKTLEDEKRGKRYGFRRKKSEKASEARIEYILDAVGMTPAKMNFETDSFDYGSWQNIWFVRDNYPCMLKPNGEEEYRLDPNDYSKKAADGEASGIENFE